MLLVLSSIWLSKKNFKNNNGRNLIYVHKPITFWVTAQTSSIKQRRLTNNIVWTRHLMSKVGLAFPEAVGFVFETYIDYSNDVSAIRVVHVDNRKTHLEDIVSAEVTIFLERCINLKQYSQICVILRHYHTKCLVKGPRWSCTKDSIIRMRSVLKCVAALVSSMYTRNSALTPVGISLHRHTCIIKCQMFENLYPKMKGMSVRPLVETMITRSPKFIMVEKRVFVVGKRVHVVGKRVVLVDTDPNHYAKDEVAEFIHVDFIDHTHDHHHAVTISKQIKVDGCFTFVADYVPLTAMCCELLNLPKATKIGAVRAKHKSATLAILRERTADLKTSAEALSHDDIENVRKVGRFPLIMKLECGCCAVGITLVRNFEEMEDKYKEIRAILKKNLKTCTEHDVDVIFHEEQLVAAFISDNGPTRCKTYTETTACMPSVLPYEKQRQLLVAAYQCCRKIGLKNGVFNINGRMGGLDLRDWVRKIYGTDLLLSACEISCDVGAGGFEFPFANITVMENDLPTARQKVMAMPKI
ncbi:hypothetical protein ACJMK2_014582 [Sinanodonta woodiana]|uniref:BL00235/CARNS1 N-terminal domain-containing protein n=1 Tax=Sinanodonta woodiana TaxID=1069815 RepID=A0ABD3V2D1_SINWO